jgi:hypothetical protein
MRTASLQGHERKSLIAELRALGRVDGCRWFPTLMDGLMDGAELHLLTASVLFHFSNRMFSSLFIRPIVLAATFKNPFTELVAILMRILQISISRKL